MENIIDLVCVDLAKCGDRLGAAAFMHATDCNFTIRSYSTDPSAAIRELMRTVQHVQRVTFALRSWQEGRVAFTRCTYADEIGRYVITYSDSSDDYAYVCAIMLSERSEGVIEIIPGEKAALALEAEAILRDKGYTVHMIGETKTGAARMATLSDFTLRRRIDWGELISDWRKPLSIQPASVEVRLDENIITYRHGDENITIDENGYELLPGEFILASTQEKVSVPADLVARVEGKSSWARRGILVHVSAGYIDPGFQGNVTLEIANLHSAKSAILHPGDRIAQIAFEDLDRPASMPYGTNGLGSHYQGQTGVTPSAMEVE